MEIKNGISKVTLRVIWLGLNVVLYEYCEYDDSYNVHEVSLVHCKMEPVIPPWRICELRFGVTSILAGYPRVFSLDNLVYF
jgi:hypothetical protein